MPNYYFSIECIETVSLMLLKKDSLKKKDIVNKEMDIKKTMVWKIIEIHFFNFWNGDLSSFIRFFLNNNIFKVRKSLFRSTYLLIMLFHKRQLFHILYVLGISCGTEILFKTKRKSHCKRKLQFHYDVYVCTSFVNDKL